jgi:hypothetical protein
MKSASESAWSQFKANMDKVGAEIKDATERFQSQFKK